MKSRWMEALTHDRHRKVIVASRVNKLWYMLLTWWWIWMNKWTFEVQRNFLLMKQRLLLQNVNYLNVLKMIIIHNTLYKTKRNNDFKSWWRTHKRMQSQNCLHFKKMAHKRKKLDALGRQNHFNINNKKHIIIEITKILQRNIDIFFSLVQTYLS